MEQQSKFCLTLCYCSNYRLIFEPHEDPIPTNENGQYLWIEIKGVEIIQIEDYH